LDASLIDAIADGFQALAMGGATAAPAQRLWMPDGAGPIQAKTAFLHSTSSYAVKVGPSGGAPGGSLMLFDAASNELRTMLLDNGFLAKLQGAAAGAVAARALSRTDAKIAGFVGAGAHVYRHAEALLLVRKIDKLLVWDQDNSLASALADRVASTHGIPAEVMSTAESVVRNSDLVVTATAARSPIVTVDWLHPGLHITAVGADMGNKNELAPEVLAEADVYVADSRKQCRWSGELTHAIGAGLINESDRIPEFGEVVAGKHPGRSDDEEITVADLTGTGVQDAAVAAHAVKRAIAMGMGTKVSNG
jgi:ornithine cyclodeaminase/alanine dehydrogenase-like protein (mu-crystallin family)